MSSLYSPLFRINSVSNRVIDQKKIQICVSPSSFQTQKEQKPFTLNQKNTQNSNSSKSTHKSRNHPRHKSPKQHFNCPVSLFSHPKQVERPPQNGPQNVQLLTKISVCFEFPQKKTQIPKSDKSRGQSRKCLFISDQDETLNFVYWSELEKRSYSSFNGNKFKFPCCNFSDEDLENEFASETSTINTVEDGLFSQMFEDVLPKKTCAQFEFPNQFKLKSENCTQVVYSFGEGIQANKKSVRFPLVCNAKRKASDSNPFSDIKNLNFFSTVQNSQRRHGKEQKLEVEQVDSFVFANDSR